MKTLKLIIASFMLMGLSSVAVADYVASDWQESLKFEQKIPPTFTYSHDLTTDGFRPLEDILATYDLVVNLFDDNDWRWEWAFIDLPGIAGDSFYFDVDGTEGGGWSLAGWAQLNAFGTLTVSVSSALGDFYLGGSQLTAHGYTKVPEPGTLALLGLGLAGLGLSRRRKIA